MTVLVSDSFNRADNTTTLGKTDSYNGGTSYTWQVATNGATTPVFGISSNQAYEVSGSKDDVAFVDIGVSDQINIQIDIPVYVSGKQRIAWRIVDGQNYFIVQDNAVYRCTNGSFTQIASLSQSVSAGSTVKISVQGNVHTFFINGTQVGSVTDSNYSTATKHGFGVWANATPRWDNFIISDNNTGGTGTTYSGAGTAQGTSSLTSSEKVIQSASGSAQGNSNLTSNETQILSASGASQGSSSLTSNETVISHTGTTYSASGTAQGSSSLSSNDKVILNASGTSQGATILSAGEHLILPASGTSTCQSSLTSNETVIGHGTTTYSASGQAQGTSSLSSNETMSYSAKGTAQGLSDLLAQEILILVASGIAQGYSSLTFIDKTNQIIGTIHLKGSANLNVYLIGSQELNVNLKGGI